MLDYDVGEVRLVRHEDDGAVGGFGHGEIEVRAASAGIFDSTEPDARSVSFEGKVLVYQDGDAVAFEGADDQRGATPTSWLPRMA